MKKGVYLQVTLQAPGGAAADTMPALLQSKLAGSHEGLSITVEGWQADPAQAGRGQAILFVEGTRPAAEDFEQLATRVVQQEWVRAGAADMAGGPEAGLVAAPPPLLEVRTWDSYDTLVAGDLPTVAVDLSVAAGGAEAGVVGKPSRPRGPHCVPPEGAADDDLSGVSSLPADTARPAPVVKTYKGCPPVGDGGEPEQNRHKNRVDTGHWRAATVRDVVNLSIPAGLPTNRSAWSPAQQAAIARFEGLPLQIEGFLAGVNNQDLESCNCHSLGTKADPFRDVDYHIWLVDAPGNPRAESVVVEISPRVRATHVGWDFATICSLVGSQAHVRISGWLMMDPNHPDQIGKTRATTWEIHPIIEFNVERDGEWVPLDVI